MAGKGMIPGGSSSGAANRIALKLGGGTRSYAAGKYLASRRGVVGVKGSDAAKRVLFQRRGIRTAGVYKAIAALDGAIAKARGGARSGLIPYGSTHQFQRAQFFEARAKRRGVAFPARAQAAKKYLASRYLGGKTMGGVKRSSGIYKSFDLKLTKK